MKSAVFLFISFFVLAVKAASVGKLNGVSGDVKTIEFDLNSDAFIVSRSDFGDRLYKLESQNQVILTKDFVSLVDVKFNSKNDAYIFEQVDYATRNVWVLSSDSKDISNVFNYSAISDLPAFFDYQDNLFLDTSSGIAVVRNGANVVDLIPRLDGFHLKSNQAYDVHTNGNVFLGLLEEGTKIDKSVMLTKAEIIKSDPRPYFLNVQRFGKIKAQKLLDGSLYLCQDYLIRYRDENVVTLIPEKIQTIFCDFYVTNNRIFVRYLGQMSGNYTVYYINEIKSDDSVVNIGIPWVINLENFMGIYGTNDKYGTVFFGTSSAGAVIEYTKVNDETRFVNIPNSIYIFGLAASDNGSLWILGQELYLVPFGQTEAVKVGGLPYMAKPSPLKAKPGTNDVFIGTDEGVFIASI